MQVPPAKITRWLRGYEAHGRHYEPLWRPQVPIAGDDGVTLGFGDLMEVRVAASFIAEGSRRGACGRPSRSPARPSARTARCRRGPSARTGARSSSRSSRTAASRPSSTCSGGNTPSATSSERSLKHVDFDEAGRPTAWWPLGPSRSVLLDPARSFGQPIEAETSVPVAALVGAVRGEGSVEAAAEAWGVPAPRGGAGAVLPRRHGSAEGGVRVLFDAWTSPRLAAALDRHLAATGGGAVHVGDLPGGPHAPDLAWVGGAGGGLVVTGDARLHSVPALRLAYRRGTGCARLALGGGFAAFGSIGRRRCSSKAGPRSRWCSARPRRPSCSSCRRGARPRSGRCRPEPSYDIRSIPSDADFGFAQAPRGLTTRHPGPIGRNVRITPRARAAPSAPRRAPARRRRARRRGCGGGRAARPGSPRRGSRRPSRRSSATTGCPAG